MLDGKLQLLLDRTKARLFAQGVHERVGLKELKARVTQPQRRLEPLERLRRVAPLRVYLRVRIRPAIAPPGPQFRKLGFRFRVPAELVIDHREALLTEPVVR